MYRRNCINNERPSGTNKCILLTFSFAAHFSMFPFKVKHCLQVTFPFSLSEMSAYVLWGAILIVTNTYKSGGLLYRIAGLFLHSSFFPILHPHPHTLTHTHSPSLFASSLSSAWFDCCWCCLLFVLSWCSLLATNFGSPNHIILVCLFGCVAPVGAIILNGRC